MSDPEDFYHEGQIEGSDTRGTTVYVLCNFALLDSKSPTWSILNDGDVRMTHDDEWFLLASIRINISTLVS